MKDWIKNLLELQTADLRTKRMKMRLNEIPKEKEQITKSLSIGEAKVAQSKVQLLEAEKDLRKIESKIEEVKEKIKGLQNKSTMVKKNDEYKALLTEIENCKVTIGGFENKQIQALDDVDAAKQSSAEAQKALQYMKDEANENIEELDELAEGLQEEIDEMMKARKQLVEKVDKRVYPLYRRLIQKPGEPLTRIHNNTCGNCHLKLTPQTLNDAKKEMVATCDTCGHLIYFSTE